MVVDIIVTTVLVAVTCTLVRLRDVPQALGRAGNEWRWELIGLLGLSVTDFLVLPLPMASARGERAPQGQRLQRPEAPWRKLCRLRLRFGEGGPRSKLMRSATPRSGANVSIAVSNSSLVLP